LTITEKLAATKKKKKIKINKLTIFLNNLKSLLMVEAKSEFENRLDKIQKRFQDCSAEKKKEILKLAPPEQLRVTDNNTVDFCDFGQFWQYHRPSVLM